MGKRFNDYKKFIHMNLDLGMTNVELAERFGVSEGTIRYHRKRNKNVDGRKNRHSAVSVYSTVIESWIQEILSPESKYRPTRLSLYRSLIEFNNLSRSYDALRRYIKKHYP